MLLARNSRNSNRQRESVAASVKAKDRAGEPSWTEPAEIVSYSRYGAGLHLSKERTVGTLVSMLIDLPSELRAYDKDREMYRIWGIVQYCSPVESDAGARYMLGVAFIGKSPPHGHLMNPERTYRIVGNDENGMWLIAKTDRSFVVRESPRIWVTLKIVLSAVGKGSDLFLEEETVTENISIYGVCALTTFDVKINGLIEFSYPEFDFTAVARVCNIRQLSDNQKRLNLEFIDVEFPVDKLVLATYEDNAETHTLEASDAEQPKSSHFSIG